MSALRIARTFGQHTLYIGLAAMLVACGGGGGSSTPTAPTSAAPPPAPTPTSTAPPPAPAPAPAPAPGLSLTSTAFAANGTIPVQHRCSGADTSPALSWTGGPAAQAYALIVEDPDAGGVFIHWVVYNIPGAARSLAENALGTGGAGVAGALQGMNDFRRTVYGGPCPPAGQTHRYFFRLFALDGALNLAAGATAAQLRQAMQGRVLAEAELMGNSPR